MTIHHKFLKIYEKDINYLITPSKFAAELLEKSGWPEKKITTIYNNAPALRLESSMTGQKKSKDKLSGDYLLYFGRIAPEKGIEDLMKAVKSHDWKLKIAGEGPEENNLHQSFATEIKLGKIIFLGQLSGQYLSNQIDDATAIIIPSRWPENMPLSLLESLAREKIVIASRVGGLPEIIKDGENGFLFTPGNIKELENKIDRLLKLGETEKKKIKLKAKASANCLNPNDHLRKIIKIYQTLAKKSE